MQKSVPNILFRTLIFGVLPNIVFMVNSKDAQDPIFFPFHKGLYIESMSNRNDKAIHSYQCFYFQRSLITQTAWLVQLVISLPSRSQGVSSLVVLRFEHLCDLLFLQVHSAFSTFQGQKMSTSVSWELTCDGLVFREGEVRLSSA